MEKEDRNVDIWWRRRYLCHTLEWSCSWRITYGLHCVVMMRCIPGFNKRLFCKSESDEAGVSRYKAYSCICNVAQCVGVRACTNGPLGEFVFLYLCLSGDFLRQTRTSSLWHWLKIHGPILGDSQCTNQHSIHSSYGPVKLYGPLFFSSISSYLSLTYSRHFPGYRPILFLIVLV